MERAETALAAKVEAKSAQGAQAAAKTPAEKADPARGKGQLGLGDKFGLYLDHFKRDHLGNDAWKQAFTDGELIKNAAFIAAFGGSFALDDGVKRHFRKEEFVGDAAKSDDWLVVAVPLTVGAFTLITPPSGFEKRYDDMAAFTETIAAAAMVGLAGKAVINRQRPDRSGNDSFPSAHVVLMFATAKYVSETWGREYGWAVKAPAYLLASFVATARLERQKHHLSDVLGGAVIGYLVADVVTKWHYGKGGINENSRVTVVPVAGPDAVGVVAEYRF